MRRLTRPLAAVLLLLVALVLSVAAQPLPTGRDWRGTGTVVALMPPPSPLHPTQPVIVLKHEPIPGLMEEGMFMPFLVATPGLLDKVQVGDRVTFSLRETADALLLVAIERAK